MTNTTVVTETGVVEGPQHPPPAVSDIEADNPLASGLSQTKNFTPLFPSTTSSKTLGGNVDGAAAASASNNSGTSRNVNDNGFPFPYIHGAYSNRNIRFSMRRRQLDNMINF